MKPKLFPALLSALLLSFAFVPLFAHHGNSVFDMGKNLTLTGSVTEFEWANPHCLIKFDVTDKQGQVTHWSGETSNPSDLIDNGWSKQSLKPGDQVTVTLNPVKNGQPFGRVSEVVFPNGRKMKGWPSLPELK